MHLNARLAFTLTVPPLMWAGNAVMGRIAIDSIDPLWLNALRWLVALALLLPLGWRAVASPPARAQIVMRWRYLAVLGFIGIGAYSALQYLALRTSTPLNVTLIASSSPIWAMVIGTLAYRVRLTRMQWLGAAISFTGVALVLTHGDPAALSGIRFVQGDLLMVLATIGWSVYSWMLARPPGHMLGDLRPAWDWAGFLLVQCLFGAVWVVASAGLGQVISPSAPTAWSWSMVLAILFMALGPSILAFRLWGLAVMEAGPTTAAVFYNLTPLFAALMSASVLGEWPEPHHGVAFALIVAGILVTSRTVPKLAR